MKKNSPVQPWEGVDGILVINMDSNPGRWQDFLDNVGCHLPQERLHRISAVAGRELPSFGKPPWFTENTGERSAFWGGTAGCVLSHRKAIAQAHSQGWRNVLIFEDDARCEHPETLGQTVVSALRHLGGRYLFYPGYNLQSPNGRKLASLGETELWRSAGVLATHAYLVPQSLFRPLLRLLPKDESRVWQWLSEYRAVDVFYRDFLPMYGVRTYVLNPPLCSQGDVASDISNAASSWAVVTAENPVLREIGPLKGLWLSLTAPFRHLKIKLNSVRTRIRAGRYGLPGFRKKNR